MKCASDAPATLYADRDDIPAPKDVKFVYIAPAQLLNSAKVCCKDTGAVTL